MIANLILVILINQQINIKILTILIKKPINADYSALTEKLKRTIKPVDLTLMIESELVNITKYKNIFSKAYTHSMSREIFVINSVLNTNSGTYI